MKGTTPEATGPATTIKNTVWEDHLTESTKQGTATTETVTIAEALSTSLPTQPIKAVPAEEKEMSAAET